MYIMDDGVKLNAKLDMPVPAEGKHPLVIVIHGFTGHMEERHITEVSKALNGIGFATLRVDMYGHGHSDGAFRDHTLYKWLTNAMTVIDYARSLEFVTDLYLCGHSQGGMTVMLAAALKHDVIRGIIPMSPATSIPEGARRGMLLGRPFDPNRIPDEMPVKEGFTLGGNYIRVAQTVHVEDAYRYQGPILFVHGDADETIPVGASVEAATHFRNSELAVIAGDSHCYDFHLDEAVAAVRDWLIKKM